MTEGTLGLRLHAKQMTVYKSKARFRVVVAGRRWGKALALDTPIPTPSGWTTMGELKDGDTVFDETGKPCKVLQAHDVLLNRKCYEVEFSDGTKIVADADHLWSTWTHSARKNARRNPNGKYGPNVVTTQAIVDTLKVGKRGDVNHSIPCAGKVQYPQAELEIDPYILGMWLGDGSSSCARIACGNEDVEHVVAQIRTILKIEPNKTREKTAWNVRLTDGHGCKTNIQATLREMGLLNNKHIPRHYLQSSVNQRLALLQGLMDTDGSCFADAGNCEFTSTNETLANNVFELILSMGIKATLSSGVAKLNGAVTGKKYRIKFSTDLPVFRLERKLKNLPDVRRFRIDHRFIVAAREVESVPVRCITVDSPNKLYLCSKAFIPTHNTALSRVILIRQAAAMPKRRVWYVAPTYRMAKQIMWTDLLDAVPRKWIHKINETSLVITLKNKSTIELKGADKPDSLRGVGIHFLVLDEFQDMSEETWTKALRPTLADTGGHAIFIGTPKAYNYLYELYKLGQDETNVRKNRWQSWQFPTITSPFIPLAEIEAARRDMDEKSFKQEFEASFETMSGRVYYPFDRTTHVGRYPFDPKLPIWVGMDFNIDPMSAVIFQPQPNGEVWAVDEIVQFGSNTDEVCNELDKRYWRSQKQITVYPDPAGGQRQHARGETDLDILRQRGFNKIKYRRKHPPVADRVNAVNRLLCAADGTILLRIDERCKNLINAFEQTIYKEGSREVDKDAGVEHAADAAGYCIDIEYPVRRVMIGGLSI